MSFEADVLLSLSVVMCASIPLPARFYSQAYSGGLKCRVCSLHSSQNPLHHGTAAYSCCWLPYVYS